MLLDNQSTKKVILFLSLPLNFPVSLVLDTSEVPGSPIGSSLGFLAAEPLFFSCLTSVEPEATMQVREMKRLG